MDKEAFHIWEGVLDEFPEEDPDHVFDSQKWVKALVERTEKNLELLGSKAFIPENAIVHEYPLPILVALETARTSQPVRILDFGGGLGATYFMVSASIPDQSRFVFHVVEGEVICGRGRELFKKYTNIEFHASLPGTDGRGFDVVHSASAFQYVKDWEGLLTRFARYSPRHIVFGNLLAGEIRPFVTYQNYYGKKIPVRFHNLSEIIEKLNAVGYCLVYKALHRQTLLGERQRLPMENFPESLRLAYGCNLIFERKDGGE